MSTDQKKIFVMGGIFLGAIVVFVAISFLILNKGGDTQSADGTGMPPGQQMATPPPPDGMTPPPGGAAVPPPPGGAAVPPPGGAPAMTPPAGMPTAATPGGMPGAPGAPGAGAKPAYTAPAAPSVNDTPTRVAAAHDPFMFGPYKPPAPPKPLPPPLTKVYAVAPVLPQPDRFKGSKSAGVEITIVEKKPPIGRHAGWIYNSNGQVWAVFVDSKGVAQTVTVGTPVSGGMHVKAISPTYLILADDATGREERIKLEGLDTYQGKTRETSVDVTPTTPRWGGN